MLDNDIADNQSNIVELLSEVHVIYVKSNLLYWHREKEEKYFIGMNHSTNIYLILSQTLKCSPDLSDLKACF